MGYEQMVNCLKRWPWSKDADIVNEDMLKCEDIKLAHRSSCFHGISTICKAKKKDGRNEVRLTLITFYTLIIHYMQYM